MKRVAQNFETEEREMLCALLRKLFDEQNSDVVNALVLARARRLIEKIPGVSRALGIVQRIPFLPDPWEELEALVDREMPGLALEPIEELLECGE